MTASVGWRASVDDTRDIHAHQGNYGGWDVTVTIGRYGLDGLLLLTKETARHLADEIYDTLSIGLDDGSDDLHTRIKEGRAY